MSVNSPSSVRVTPRKTLNPVVLRMAVLRPGGRLRGGFDAAFGVVLRSRVMSRYAAVTTKRKSSSRTDIAEPMPKFQVRNDAL